MRRNYIDYSFRSTQLSFVSKKSAFSSFPNQWWKQKVNMSQNSMDKKGLLNYPYKKVKLFIFSFDYCYDLFLILWYLWCEYISYLLYIYIFYISYGNSNFLQEQYYSNFFSSFPFRRLSPVIHKKCKRKRYSTETRYVL